MITTKICPICLKQFQTAKNAKKFCSDQCRAEFIKQSKKKKCICSWCNKTFYTLRKKTYCSEQCRMFANARVSIPKKEINKKPKISLDEVAKLARECGMTYGKYVQQFGL